MSSNIMKSMKPNRSDGRRNKQGFAGLKQGYFPIERSIKYTGPRPCIYRSSYEFAYMRYCEENNAIKNWSSEPFGIEYFSPTGKKHTYYIDFTLLLQNGEQWLIEVKPYVDTIPKEDARYRKNRAKWVAAKEWAVAHGWKFAIITEKHSSLKGRVC